MLFAIGAGSQVIGVSSYDDFPPEAKSLPRVGALLDPDVERILALRPDLVFTYGSQGGLEAQLTAAGIRSLSYRHNGIDALFETLRDIGEATGQPAGADRVTKEIKAKLDAVRARVRGRPRPKTLLVLGRQPQSLRQIYVSGGAGVLHEVLEAAGGVNVFGDIVRESVQPTREALIERRPEVIVEVSGTRAAAGVNPAKERAVWSALSSIPAVRDGRVHFLTGDYLVVPGPRIGLAAETLARALHPDAFK
jgi:iron complex transport system substrate-binding protein